LIVHSDRGSQYACGQYQALLVKHGFVCSMSRKGNCWDTQFMIVLERPPNLTRAGIGESAFALTCRLGCGVPQALLGLLPVT
jgi:putative transposase